MSATVEVMQLLAEWGRLSEGEHQAILCDDWDGVAHCQASKTQLSCELTDALHRLHAVPASSQDESQLQARGAELMAQERRNLELVEHKRQRQSEERTGLRETNRNLRQVRRAYGGLGGHLWQSYS